VISLITIKQTGDFNKTDKFFNKVKLSKYLNILDKYGREGVKVLSSVTPIDSGNTAKSWDYKIKRTLRGVSISWVNSNIINGVPIAIILQYGHGTRNGGYVKGVDYINPAVRPIFNKITEDIWKEVTSV
jgi:hypothetical protein